MPNGYHGTGHWALQCAGHYRKRRGVSLNTVLREGEREEQRRRRRMNQAERREGEIMRERRRRERGEEKRGNNSTAGRVCAMHAHT